ncbi:MAG: hypothetical protein QOF30_716 [Acidimicrobiaceae bacterium]|nr:hypothetical protein [Acidimicrobiaceae bacterium]
MTGTAGLGRYLYRGKRLATNSLTGDSFVVAMNMQLRETFTGTSAELLAASPSPERVAKHWPGNARQVTTLLKRQAPVMRRAGWTVDDLPPGHDNVVRWRITRPEKAGNPDSQHSQSSQDRPGASDARFASVGYRQSQDAPDDLDPYRLRRATGTTFEGGRSSHDP